MAFSAVARADGIADTAVFARLDAGAGVVTGTVRLAVDNPTHDPLDRAYVWLYPNRFAVRPSALDDVTFYWVYPDRFDAGWMRITAARQAGRAASARVEPHALAGDGALVAITLPSPVAPGERLELELAYEAHVPERYGGYGCLEGTCTLAGGLHPLLATLDPAGWDLEAPPQVSRFSGRLELAADAVIVAGGAVVKGAVATLAGGPAPYLPVVVAPVLHEKQAVRRGVSVAYLSARAPPPAPDAAEQAFAYTEEDYAAMALAAAGDAIDLLHEIGAPVPEGTIFTIVEVPLRLDLAEAHPGLVLCSDRLFRLFPFRRFRKYHERELVRALFTEHLARRPAPEGVGARDALAGPETAAAYLMDLYTVREFHKQEFAREILAPVSFVPAVDQLIYAPQVAFAGAYFGAIADTDAFRDDPRRWNHERPAGHVLYHKLQDLLAPEAFGEAMRAVVLGERGVRAAAEAAYGEPLGWFFRQWNGPYPEVDYALGARRREKLAGGTWRHTITVEKRVPPGRPAPVEPVEVRVVDGGGARHLLRWDGRGDRGEVVLETASGSLRSVHLDPRYRLVQAAPPGSPDDPRFDDRDPPRLKFLYNNFGALLSVTDLSVALAADFSFRRIHDNRNALRLQLYTTESVTVGGSIGYSRYFGPKITPNRPLGALAFRFGFARLDDDYAAGPGNRLSLSVGIGADDREVIFEPLRARGWSAGGTWSVTRFDALEGTDASYRQTVSVYGDVTKIVTPVDGHTFVGSVEAAAVAGDIEFRSQLLGAGGPTSLRGYAIGEIFGRSRLLAHGEWRGALRHDLGVNVGHFAFLRGVGAAAFVDVGALSGCSSYTDLVDADSLYASAGFGLRLFYDNFGVQPGMMALDLAVPLVIRPRDCLNVPAAVTTRPPFMIYLTFLPPF